jgi:hypothetical protein
MANLNSEDKLKIFENVIARVGIENALKEYTRAISSLNGFQSMQELTPPMPEINSAVDAGGTISPPMNGSMPQGNPMPNQPLM